MGVDRIIKQCPRDARKIEHDGDRTDAVGMRGPGEQRAPVKGDTQEGLRPPCKALCEGIDCNRQECEDTECNSGWVERDQDEEGQKRLDDHPEQRGADGHLTRWDGPRAGAGYRAINLAVRDVIPRTAGTSHQEGPKAAADNRPKVVVAVAIRRENGEGQTPHAGRKKEPGANRPVRTAEPQERARDPWCETVHPVVCRCVGYGTVHIWRRGVFGHMVRLMASKVRLYVDHPLGEGQSVPLNREQAHYLFGVMRLGEGDVLSLINGIDGEWDAGFVEVGKKGGVLLCHAQTKPLFAPPDLWLLFAPIRKERTAFIVEKAVEMGASRICPVQTDFTQKTNRVRRDKLQAHSVEAAEQCGGTFVPPVDEIQKLDRVLADWPAERQLMFCDEALIGDPVVLPGTGGSWAILIGPEGGFSPAERDRLRASPFAHPVSLGPRILRADTAAVAALTIWQRTLGDWA